MNKILYSLIIGFLVASCSSPKYQSISTHQINVIHDFMKEYEPTSELENITFCRDSIDHFQLTFKNKGKADVFYVDYSKTYSGMNVLTIYTVGELMDEVPLRTRYIDHNGKVLGK